MYLLEQKFKFPHIFSHPSNCLVSRIQHFPRQRGVSLEFHVTERCRWRLVIASSYSLETLDRESTLLSPIDPPHLYNMDLTPVIHPRSSNSPKSPPRRFPPYSTRVWQVKAPGGISRTAAQTQADLVTGRGQRLPRPFSLWAVCFRFSRAAASRHSQIGVKEERVPAFAGEDIAWYILQMGTCKRAITERSRWVRKV